MILANTTNFVLAGGGEPGLLLAGLAIADELRSSIPRSRIIFAGAGTGPEVRRICRAGYEYVALGGACEDRPGRAWQWPWTRWGEPRLLLKRTRPAAVVSLGGAIGEAVGRAAAGLRLPLAILEQHVSPSLATRRLAAKAQLICLGFEETRRNLVANCPIRVTGIPVSATPIVAAIETDSPECSQVRTARTLAQRAACLLVEQPDQEQAWTQVLKPSLSDSGHRRRLTAAMQRHFRNDAAWHMAGMIRDLISSAAAHRVA